MRLLALSNLFPLPVDRGHAVRLGGFLEALAVRHDLHVLALRRPDTTPEVEAAASALLRCPVEAFGPIPPVAPGAVAMIRRWARAMRDATPPWIAREFDRTLLARAVELAPHMDAVVLTDDFAFAYAPHLAGLAPVVGDKNTVLGGSAFARPRPGLTPAGTLNHHLGHRITRRFERRTCRHVDVIVATNELESEAHAALYERRPEVVVPSGVRPTRRAAPLNGSRSIGVIGSMAWPPNVDGLVRFVDEGWDRLAGRGFELWVIGAGEVPERVLDLERRRGVRLLGFVEDLERALMDMAAAVVPIWSGAGVRLKTLTVMGAGLPTAATPAALEGVPAVDGEHCLVGRTPEALAAALDRVLSDPREAARLGRSARALVERDFSWEAVGARFADAVELAAARRESLSW